jgi:hypothetical protein
MKKDKTCKVCGVRLPPWASDVCYDACECLFRDGTILPKQKCSRCGRVAVPPKT